MPRTCSSESGTCCTAWPRSAGTYRSGIPSMNRQSGFRIRHAHDTQSLYSCSQPVLRGHGREQEQLIYYIIIVVFSLSFLASLNSWWDPRHRSSTISTLHCDFITIRPFYNSLTPHSLYHSRRLLLLTTPNISPLHSPSHPSAAQLASSTRHDALITSHPPPPPSSAAVRHF